MTLDAASIAPPAADCDAEAARRAHEAVRAHVRRGQLAHDLRALPPTRRAVVVLHAMEAVRFGLCLALAAAGIETHGAGTARDADALIAAHHPGVLVAHYFLTPAETARALVQSHVASRAVVIVSAAETKELRAVAARLGATLHTTPTGDVETAAFVERVKALLGDSP